MVLEEEPFSASIWIVVEVEVDVVIGAEGFEDLVVEGNKDDVRVGFVFVVRVVVVVVVVVEEVTVLVELIAVVVIVEDDVDVTVEIVLVDVMIEG